MTNFDSVKRGGGVGKWPPRKIFAKDAPLPIKSQRWGQNLAPSPGSQKCLKNKQPKGWARSPPRKIFVKDASPREKLGMGALEICPPLDLKTA